MPLRPALAGGAIIALLLTGCAGTPEPETSPRTAASGTTARTASPEPTATPEPSPTSTPVGEGTAGPIPAVTAIVLHPRTLDFLAADGTTVDSVALTEPDDAAKIISHVLEVSPAVEHLDNGYCGEPSTVSTWPGGLILTERSDGSEWWSGVARYFVTFEGPGYDGVSFQTEGGYKVGDRVTADSGVPGAMRTLDADGSLFMKFATELGDPNPPERQGWGVIASGYDWVIEEVHAPAPLDIGRC